MSTPNAAAEYVNARLAEMEATALRALDREQEATEKARQLTTDLERATAREWALRRSRAKWRSSFWVTLGALVFSIAAHVWRSL